MRKLKSESWLVLLLHKMFPAALMLRSHPFMGSR